MGLSRAVSEINGDFSRKLHTTVYLMLPMKAFRLELGIDAWSQKTRMIELSDQEISLTISSATLDTIYERDRRTDGQTEIQTDTGRQQRPRLYT